WRTSRMPQFCVPAIPSNWRRNGAGASAALLPTMASRLGSSSAQNRKQQGDGHLQARAGFLLQVLASTSRDSALMESLWTIQRDRSRTAPRQQFGTGIGNGLRPTYAPDCDRTGSSSSLGPDGTTIIFLAAPSMK